jgi:hypothetical protein
MNIESWFLFKSDFIVKVWLKASESDAGKLGDAFDVWSGVGAPAPRAPKSKEKGTCRRLGSWRNSD